MQEPQILSTLEPPPSLPRAASSIAGESTLFDVCHPGVVLRAVLLVEITTAVAAMFVADSPAAWVQALAVYSAGSLPAVLVWLTLACGSHRWSRSWSLPGLFTWGAALGALAGLAGGAVLGAVQGEAIGPPWIACASAGAFVASLVVAGLVARARAQAPAHAAARLEGLQARIRPHFLFNTLNSAIALIRAEPARAEALLEDLSDLFRHALEDTAGAKVSLAQEIELARRYLAIEQVRFGDRLDVQWQIDSEALEALLPSLLLQPLVENAVRHGVEPSTAGARVRISAERRGQRAVIKVANTVPAGPGRPGHGLALANVRERLQLLHDVEAVFAVREDQGVFQVRIEVPCP